VAYWLRCKQATYTCDSNASSFKLEIQFRIGTASLPPTRKVSSGNGP